MLARPALAATVALACAATIATHASAEPFTYQGLLNDNGAPANGEYDIRFELYDAPVGGDQIGPIQAAENTPVIDGVFTAEIDFGDGVFQGGPRYLRIGVRPGDSGGLFTFLDPRTPINPAPAAQHATTADALASPIWTQSGSVVSTAPSASRVFINRDAPLTSADYFGVSSDVAGFVGMYIAGPKRSVPFYGYSANGDVSAYTYYNDISERWGLWMNSRTIFETFPDGEAIFYAGLRAERFEFESPKTSYCSISGDSFYAASGDPFRASSGTGGAYISSPGSGWLVAPVSLPHGAVITRMRATFNDNVAGSMSISLTLRTHGGDGGVAVATVSSAGLAGNNIEGSTTAISVPIVNNNASHYHMRVFSSNWPGTINLAIKSVVIEYTTTEAD